MLQGHLDDLLNSRAHDGHEDDYVAVTLTDTARPEGAMDKLRARFPHILTLEFKPEGVTLDKRSYGQKVRGRDDLAVAAEFVRHVRNTEASEPELALLEAAFAVAAHRDEPLMRPHRLRVTAFGAFAGTEQVTFDDLEGLFLLHGETGAGKTTLLDAIAFALYGRVPGERGTARRLRSDHASPGTATEVELEATIGGRRLRVTRKPEQARPKKSGAGTTTEQASVRLAELAPDGTWESKSTRIGEVDAEIENLMGMSAAQFFQVVLLPQGEFAKFLRADAKEKESLLQKLFSTDRFRQVEDWLADRRRATDKEVAAADADLARLVAQLAQAAGTAVPSSAAVLDSPELAEQLVMAGRLTSTASPAMPGGVASGGSAAAWQATWAAALRAKAAAERDTAAALVDARKADLEASLAARRQAEQLADRQRRRSDAMRRQAELDAAAPEIEQVRSAASEHMRAVGAAAADDGVGARAAHAAESAALHAAGQEQQAQVGRLEALRAVARQANVEDATAAAARGRADELSDDLELARVDALRRQAVRSQTEQSRGAASRAAVALPVAQAQANAARQIAGDCATLATEHAKRSELRETHLTAREQAVAAQAAALRVREARIDGMRAELAAQMTDGSPCPVCGSLDHPDPVDASSFPPVSQDAEDTAFRLAGDAAAGGRPGGPPCGRRRCRAERPRAAPHPRGVQAAGKRS